MKNKLIHLLTLISAGALCSCASDFRSLAGDFGRRPGGYGFDLRRDTPRDTGWRPRFGGGGGGGGGGGVTPLRLLGGSGSPDVLTPAGPPSFADRLRIGSPGSTRLAPGARERLMGL